MYSDKKKHKSRAVAAACVIAAVVAVLIFSIMHGSGDHLDDESQTAIREAVRRSAQQCYVVEGVYPASLAYLEENYGLQVNQEDYYITYEAFASNLPPEVRVTKK